MQATEFWNRFVKTTESADLEELRHDIIRIISLVLFIIGWLVTLSATRFEGNLEYLPTALMLLAGSIIGVWLRSNYFRAAPYWLMTVMIGAITWFKWFSPATLAQYFFPVAIVVSSLMMSSVGVFVVAIIASVVCATVAYSHGVSWFDSQEIVTPAILIYLTALAGWLNSRQVNSALDCMENSYVRARDLLEQLRDERMKQARTLKSLEDAFVRIEKMNHALIEAHRVAEEARQFKSEFVANVSHELRTPLNLIIGFTEMMATAPEGYGSIPLPSAYRGDVMATYRNACHLHALIDDVLDLSRIESGSMPLNRELIDLGEVIREAAEMVRALVEARGLSLELAVSDELPKLFIDRTRIRQVLLNLLTNSARFADRGKICVRTRLDASEVRVTVEDHGRGIDPARLARAFEAFSQLEDGQAREGSGLGLAVSKRFVELHGGSMWIESEVGRGTTVYFTVPLPNEAKTALLSRWMPSQSWRASAEEPLVLVLHDDLRILPLLRRYISGYQYRLAETTDRAREMIREAMPAAVIMDTTWANHSIKDIAELALPSGLTLLRCPLPSARRLGLLVGAADYVSKPVSRDDLSNALARLPNPPQTVLVVDDEPDFVRLVERMMKADHPSVRVLEAFGGKQGLEIAHAERPDLIFLDLAMPDIDGYAFLGAMAGDRATEHTSIIIVSATGFEQESAPLLGEVCLQREAGFSLSEMLRALQMTLAAVTPWTIAAPATAGVSPTSDLG